MREGRNLGGNIMWKKKVMAVWIAFVFVFGSCFGYESSAQAYEAGGSAAQESSGSTNSESAAQDTGTADQDEEIDYKEVSEMISSNWEDDYFGEMVIEPGTNDVEVDGEEEKLSEEFDISTSKAKSISASEETMEDYLERQDGVYEVEENKKGGIEVTAPYQTRRLIVLSSYVPDTYGASEVFVNSADGETILQYDTEEETQTACDALQKQFGEENCFPDAIVSVESYSSSAMQTASASAQAESLAQAASAGNSYSWGASYMGMDTLKQEAASLGYTRKVMVAVIDSGINSSNQFFSGRTISKKSVSFIDGNIKDVYGHGTHVAGIIADCTPSNVQLMMLKVVDEKGRASLLGIGYALYYAVAENVNVINLSVGYPDAKANQMNYLDDVIDKAYERGIPICAAAGNDGTDVSKCYPACNSQVLSVSAIGQNGTLASYSNRGSGIEFAAPGTYVLSADWKGTVKYMSGTSMAAPHIAAAAAYIKMAKPNISVEGLCKELRLYCKDLGASGRDSSFGWGCPVMTGFLRKGITYSDYNIILRPTLKSVSNTKKGITLKWKKAVGAAEYCIYRKKNKGAWRQIAVVSSARTSYTDRKVKRGVKYSYRVRARNSGKYGRVSATKKVWRLTTMKKAKLRRKSGRKVLVSWKKKKYAGKYQIQYARNASFKKAKKISASGSKRSRITKKLKKGTWYFRIRYRRSKGGVKSWSGWSAVTRIRIH